MSRRGELVASARQSLVTWQGEAFGKGDVSRCRAERVSAFANVKSAKKGEKGRVGRGMLICSAALKRHVALLVTVRRIRRRVLPALLCSRL